MIKQFDSLYDMMEAFPDEQSCIDHPAFNPLVIWRTLLTLPIDKSLSFQRSAQS